MRADFDTEWARYAVLHFLSGTTNGANHREPSRGPLQAHHHQFFWHEFVEFGVTYARHRHATSGIVSAFVCCVFYCRIGACFLESSSTYLVRFFVFLCVLVVQAFRSVIALC